MTRKFILSFSFFTYSLAGNAQAFPIASDSTSFINGTKERIQLTGEIQTFAEQLLGTRYRWGGRATHGFDCSGLVNYVFANFGMQVAHGSRELFKLGSKASLEEAQPGDLIFFKTSSRKRGVSHVGIVLEPDENGLRFIHSASSQGVIISYLKEKYYTLRFVGIRRVLDSLKDGKS